MSVHLFGDAGGPHIAHFQAHRGRLRGPSRGIAEH
jgi:hypothetical protein